MMKKTSLPHAHMYAYARVYTCLWCMSVCGWYCKGAQGRETWSCAIGACIVTQKVRGGESNSGVRVY